MRVDAIGPLEAASYVSHALHRSERAFHEANCYADLWIEVLHALDVDPVAMLPFTLSADFEGDQWTFFKPPLGDLMLLYGVEVQELNVWARLADHVREQVALRRIAIVEADAFFLPDTAGTSFGVEHTKTAIAVQAIDLERERLGYFHNGGYYELSGRDFRGMFRLDEAPGASLPPYVELVKLAPLVRHPEAELVRRSKALAREHLGRRPRENPITRFAERFEADLAWLCRGDLAGFHRYAFATLRQCGACSELAAFHVRWLEARGSAGVAGAAAALDSIAASAKTLMFKTARAVNGKKPLESGPIFASMAASWEAAMGALDAQLGP